MKVGISSIFADLPDAVNVEKIEQLVEAGSFRVERIVSFGQATPDGYWYDQAEDEWVLLLTGRAGLLIFGEDEARIMGPGDYLYLPAGCRHRVAWTVPDVNTIWLAVHGLKG